MNKFLTFLFLIVINSLLTGQNLVPNPSFEEYSPGKNPNGSSKGYIVNNWKSPTAGTPDFYIKWSIREGDKDNWTGYKVARTGECYMGIITRFVFEPGDAGDYREYIQAKLSRKLVRNQKYKVTFYSLLAPNAKYAADGLAAYLSKTPMDTSCYDGFLNVEPQITTTEYGILKNSLHWKKITDIYTAQGGEEYIIIGNFNSNFNTQYEDIPEVNDYNKYTFAFYFVDDVSVEPVNYFNDDLSLGQTIVLKNLAFTTGKSDLLAGSLEELTKLVRLMKEYQSLEIEISGHTDNEGTEPYNLKLSRERAKSVAEYLVSQGIERSRIQYIGYGSKAPVAENSTEDGRDKNRRVEFKILKI